MQRLRDLTAGQVGADVRVGCDVEPHLGRTRRTGCVGPARYHQPDPQQARIGYQGIKCGVNCGAARRCELVQAIDHDPDGFAPTQPPQGTEHVALERVELAFLVLGQGLLESVAGCGEPWQAPGQLVGQRRRDLGRERPTAEEGHGLDEF